MSQQMFVDYYETFGLDRSMTERQLKKELGKKSVEVAKLQSTTSPNDTQTRQELEKVKAMILDAIKILGHEASRKAYDQALDEATRAGRVSHETTEEVKQAIERARKYFEAQNYPQALKWAQEALKSNVNSDEPYEIICRSQFMMGDYEEAIHSADVGAKAFSGAVKLWWLKIRIRIKMELYDQAQSALNEAMNLFSGNAQFAAEQAYFYFHAGQDEAGTRLVESYIKEHPNDTEYRQYTAYNLIEVANQYYKYDSSADMLLITEEKDYKECRKLITLANRFYQDDYTRKALSDVEQYGEIVYIEENKPKKMAYSVITVLALIGAVLSIMGGGSPLICLIVAAVSFIFLRVIEKYSYRPVWQQNRDYYRGFTENSEGWLYNLASAPIDLAMSMINGL